jgi:NAD/NADP transhydrogenase alpha subunit
MATRRRTSRHANLPARANLKNQLVRAATGRTAKTAYALIGTAGLAALAIAIFGPRRFQREILAPVQNKVSEQASQVWADSQGLRQQIGDFFGRVQNQASREKLARGFQSWIGHFRAT